MNYKDYLRCPNDTKRQNFGTSRSIDNITWHYPESEAIVLFQKIWANEEEYASNLEDVLGRTQKQGICRWIHSVISGSIRDLAFFWLWMNVKSASSPFAQSFSHAKPQQRSDILPQHEMHQLYQSMTRGRLFCFFNRVVITKSSIDM